MHTYKWLLFTLFLNTTTLKNWFSDWRMVVFEGLLRKLVQQCYAVLCLGVIVVTVTVAHCVYGHSELNESPKERTRSRLRAIHGTPVDPARSIYNWNHGSILQESFSIFRKSRKLRNRMVCGFPQEKAFFFSPFRIKLVNYFLAMSRIGILQIKAILINVIRIPLW